MLDNGPDEGGWVLSPLNLHSIALCFVSFLSFFFFLFCPPWALIVGFDTEGGRLFLTKFSGSPVFWISCFRGPFPPARWQVVSAVFLRPCLLQSAYLVVDATSHEVSPNLSNDCQAGALRAMVQKLGGSLPFLLLLLLFLPTISRFTELGKFSRPSFLRACRFPQPDSFWGWLSCGKMNPTIMTTNCRQGALRRA